MGNMLNLNTILFLGIFALASGIEYPFKEDFSIGEYVQPFEWPILGPGKYMFPPEYDTQPYILLMVHSYPHNGHLRNKIRNTWALGAWEMYKIKVVFFMGLDNYGNIPHEILTEYRVYKDIVLEDFYDTFQNASIKSLHALKWAANEGKFAKFVFKMMDEGTASEGALYANLTALINLAHKYEYYPAAFVGELHTASMDVARDPSQIMYTPEYFFKDKTYPPYLTKYAVLMSMNTVVNLFNYAYETHFFTTVEEIYISGMLPLVAGITLVGDAAFDFKSKDSVVYFYNFLN